MTWKILLRKQPSLSTFEPSVREGTVSDLGTVYRLMVTGSRAKLRELCGAISQSGTPCLLLKGI